jgi:ATP-dependent Clp protease ATP-binding subunit ClpC
MDFNKFTDKAQELLMISQAILERYGHMQMDTDHLLLAMMEQPEGTIPKILEELHVDVVTFTDEIKKTLEKLPKVSISKNSRQMQVYLTPAAQKVISEICWDIARQMGDDYVATEHILIAIADEGTSPGARILNQFDINKESARRGVLSVRGSSRVNSPNAEGQYKALAKYSRDLTKMAREGKLDPVIGRDNEIRRVIEILSRRTKNNPALIGEPGVGKTAIVEGLAQAIIQNQVPQTLKNKRVISLDLSSMVAGSKFRGEFEERMKAVMDEIRQAQGEIVLFIDELHTVVGAGASEGAIDASNMMKPALARGELQCVGATTLDEYRKYIEKDSALERRFQPVFVDEPTISDTIKILHGLKERYEKHHEIKYTDDALEAAVTLSARYIPDRFLPDKAIDLIDESGARKHIDVIFIPGDVRELEQKILNIENLRDEAALKQNYEQAAHYKQEIAALQEQVKKIEAEKRPSPIVPVVTKVEIAELIERVTGIPVKRMFEEESSRLLLMEEDLHKRVIGQDYAISVISEAIRRARAGLKDPKRPIGSFVFMGPTGVGKTELARALAEFMFNDEDSMIRVDMSEYMEKHSVSRLIGAPPGYIGFDEGGQLTEQVRRRPYRVILFDEIEKAHPDIFNILLQLLEDGRLTDNVGRVADFKNCVIIMTSNVGSHHIIGQQQQFGFSVGDEVITENSYESLQEKAIEDLKHIFRPELLNRIDEVVVFLPLKLEEIVQIVDMLINNVRKNLLERNLYLEISDDVRLKLANDGYDPAYGARPLRRIIQKQIENLISRGILEGKYKDGEIIKLDLVDGKIQ